MRACNVLPTLGEILFIVFVTIGDDSKRENIHLLLQAIVSLILMSKGNEQVKKKSVLKRYFKTAHQMWSNVNVEF